MSNDLIFLDDLADQIEDVGVSQNKVTADRLRQVVENLRKPGTGMVPRSTVEAAWSSERDAHAKANTAANAYMDLEGKVDHTVSLLEEYFTTGEIPEAILSSRPNGNGHHARNGV